MERARSAGGRRDYWQIPLRQIRLPQQPRPFVQLVPVRPQHTLPVSMRLLEHTRPAPQQLGAAAVAEHATPSVRRQVVDGAAQRPERQMLPEQQSVSAEHSEPVVWQAQRPVTQNIWPQQSRSVEQVPVLSTQQCRVLGLGRHDSPVQHEVGDEEHDAVRAEQVPVAQRPARQISPEQHAEFDRHDVPEAPHIGAVAQRPVWQVSPVQHIASPVQVAPDMPHVGAVAQRPI